MEVEKENDYAQKKEERQEVEVREGWEELGSSVVIRSCSGEGQGLFLF